MRKDKVQDKGASASPTACSPSGSSPPADATGLAADALRPTGAERVDGPWSAYIEDVPYSELGEAWTVNNDNGSICTVDCPRADAERVAHLIAAAPELFEALAALLGNIGAASLSRNEVGKRLRDNAAAALSKALGHPSGDS